MIVVVWAAGNQKKTDHLQRAQTLSKSGTIEKLHIMMMDETYLCVYYLCEVSLICHIIHSRLLKLFWRFLVPLSLFFFPELGTVLLVSAEAKEEGNLPLTLH
jgi:hypothetical protein